MDDTSELKNIKVVILGDQGVGKTNILLRFVTQDFHQNSQMTIGSAFMAKIIKRQEKSIKYLIWDTAGQEKYRSLAPLYYRDAAVCIVVYDLCNPDSFEVMKQWVDEVKEFGMSNAITVIAANKCDLQDQKQDLLNKGQSYANQQGLIFFKTSAKDNIGITEMFEMVADKYILQEQQVKNNKIHNHKLSTLIENKKNCNC